MPGPLPSEPDQETVKLELVVVAGSAATMLDGGLTSMVLTSDFVAIGAFWSKTTVAYALMTVPVARFALGRTV